MPILSEVDKSRDLTIFTVKGQMTFQEQIDTLKKFYDGNPTKKAIWDFRNMTGERYSSEEVRQIILFTKQHEDKRPGGRTALVATADLDYGINRMSDALAQTENIPWKIGVFRSMDEALKWLDE